MLVRILGSERAVYPEAERRSAGVIVVGFSCTTSLFEDYLLPFKCHIHLDLLLPLRRFP
jgi:hypothetical protein